MSYVFAFTDAHEPEHRHDGGCTWAGCGPWPEDEPFYPGLDDRGAVPQYSPAYWASHEPEPPDTLRELREDT